MTLNLTLSEGLALLGGLVLLGVLANGLYQARKASPRQPDEASPNSRLEPHLGSPGGAGSAGTVPGAGTGSAHLAPERSASASAMSDHPSRYPVGGAGLDPDGLPVDLRPALPRKSARLDPLIDAIASLALDAPISGELALVHLPPSRRAGNKPFLIEGLNSDSGDWELPAAGRRYGAFQAGVQLANRSGALNEIEYSEFVQKLQAFADGVGAMAELPDMLDVVARGRELDAFAGDHDAQLSLTLRANGAAWSVGYLQQCAARHGFIPGVLPGRLVMPGAEDASPPVLVLQFDQQVALADDPAAASLRQVQLSLDVPQTAEAAEPFPAWHQAARLLAADMDAVMIDDSGRPITLHAFASIGTDLATLYAALASRDLAAGSPAARRLFS